MRKWGLVIKAGGFALLLVIGKALADTLNWDVIPPGTILSAYIGGVIFTLAILFTGTLADYKESEKLPSELAVSLRSLHQDARLASLQTQEIARNMQSHIRELVKIINAQLAKSAWPLREINGLLSAIDDDIVGLTGKSVPPQFIAKMRVELTNIDRISHRIRIIMETSFIPAAYAISEIAAGTALFLLFFVELEPYYEGLAYFGVVSLLLMSLMFLLKDMDNPFAGYARVDLSPLEKLPEYLEEQRE